MRRVIFPSEFHAIGYIHFTEKQWWSKMVSFTLAQFEELLWQAGLYGAVRAIMHDILQSNHHFYVILECYNPETCKFFTPIREMGFALHEMYEVSGLLMGDTSYEKYVTSIEELYLLKKDDPLIYETYWEVPCYFHICARITKWRSRELGKWCQRAIFSTV